MTTCSKSGSSKMAKHSVFNFAGANSFKGLRPGNNVVYARRCGLNIRGEPDWDYACGRVVMAFETHVVLNIGGRHGTPMVVNDNNFIRRGTLPRKPNPNAKPARTRR
jgi:hypothetical protein